MYDLPFGRDRKWLTSAPLASSTWRSAAGRSPSSVISRAAATSRRLSRCPIRPARGSPPRRRGPSSRSVPISCAIQSLSDPDHRPLVRRGALRRAANRTLRHGRARRDRRAWTESLALRTAQAIQADRSSARPDVPHRADERRTSSTTPQWASPNMNVTPTNVSAGKISAIGGTIGLHPAGRHAGDAARFPDGVVTLGAETTPTTQRRE